MLIAAACVALASCVKNEVEPIVNDEPISFQAVKGVEGTRAIFGDTGEDHFIASALLHQSGETWAANKATAQDFFLNQEVTKYGNADTDAIVEWTTATPYYWPEQGSLTFFAYYPKTIIFTSEYSNLFTKFTGLFKALYLIWCICIWECSAVFPYNHNALICLLDVFQLLCNTGCM